MLRVALIPLALIAMLAGAIVWSGGGHEKRADFAFINRGDIFTLDFNNMSYMQDFRLTYGIREGLYNLDSTTFKPIPAAATEYKLSEDEKVWTFTIRKGMKWSNGDPVTAHDFVFSWRRMLTEPGEYSYLFYYIKNTQKYEQSYSKGDPIPWDDVGVKAVDDYTLQVTLNNKVSYFLELMAFPPFYPRHERSMIAWSGNGTQRVFRQWADDDLDVIEPFHKYVAAAQGLNPAAGVEKELARRVGDADRALPVAAVIEFVKAAQGYQENRATEAEMLRLLEKFAAMKPLDGVAASGELNAENAMTGMPPAQKLERMVSRKFVRYVFNKEYTRPPYVVTNGAFRLKDWDFKRRILLEKSENYWDRDKVRSNTIEMLVAETPQAQLLMYETGQVDWVSEVTAEQAAELRDKGRKDLRTSPAFGTMFLTLMCKPNLPQSLGSKKNPLADARVRQALAMSIDKRFVIEKVTRMGELPARTYLPPDGTLPRFVWQPGIYDQDRSKPYDLATMRQRLQSADALTGPGAGLPYDVATAKKLLAEAGYPDGKNFPQLPILYNTDSDTRRQLAQVLKDQWKRALNIDISIQAVEGKIFSRNVSEKDYWIATAAWYGDYPDISTFTDKYLSSSLNNDSAWESKEFDELCDKAAQEEDDAKRIDLLSRAEHMIDTQMPIIPIYHYINISLSRDNVFGVAPNPRNITIFKDVEVRKGKR